MGGSKEKIIIYTDGGSRGNPGPAALGVSISDARGHIIAEYGEYIGETTNNVAEYRAIVSALQKAKALIGKKKIREILIEVRMDSQLAARQINGAYRIEDEKLFPLFMKIWNLKIDFGEIRFIHIPREENTRADTMVNTALDDRRKQRQLL